MVLAHSIITNGGSVGITSGRTVIGSQDTGVLNITDGSLLDGPFSSAIGFFPGGQGMVNVNGINAFWTSNGSHLFAGDSGVGELRITDGGTVNSRTGRIGFAAGSDGTAWVDDATWNNSGGLEVGVNGNATLTVINGGTVNVAGLVEIAPQAQVNMDNSTPDTGSLNNAGGMELQGLTEIFGDVNHTGNLLINNGSTTSFADAVTNNGTSFEVEAGSVAKFLGAYSGAAAISGLGTIQFEGEANGGNSPALTVIEGDVVFTPTSTLIIELGGLAPGTEYDVWSIGGDLQLSGTLQIDLINGFRPDVGDAFDFLNAGGGVFGAFSNIVFPTLPGFAADIGQGINGFSLSVTAGPLPAGVWLFGSALFFLLIPRVRKD